MSSRLEHMIEFYNSWSFLTHLSIRLWFCSTANARCRKLAIVSARMTLSFRTPFVPKRNSNTLLGYTEKRSTFLNASFSNRLTLSIFCSIHPLILQWFHTRPIARWELPLSDQTAGMLHTDGYIRIFYPPHAVRLRMSAYRHLLLPVGKDTSHILRFDSVTVLRFHFYNYVNFLTIKFY